jgi:hypothetical protein
MLSSLPSAPKPCHSERSRATKGSKGEWRNPDALSCAMPHQGVLPRHFYSDWKYPVGNTDLLKRIERFSPRRGRLVVQGRSFSPAFAEGERASSLAGNRTEKRLSARLFKPAVPRLVSKRARIQSMQEKVTPHARKSPSWRYAIPSRSAQKWPAVFTILSAQARDLHRCCPWEIRYREPLGPAKQIPRPDNNAIEESAAISVRPWNSTSCA